MQDTWAHLTLTKLHEFGPQALSNTAWSFSRLGFHSAHVYDAIAAASVPQLDKFTCQGLSMMAGAFATAQHTHPPLFDEIAARAAPLLTGTADVQHSAVLAWAFATARHASPAIMEVATARVAAAVGRAEEGVEPQNLANLLWACARCVWVCVRGC